MEYLHLIYSKLILTDRSVTVQRESSAALGKFLIIIFNYVDMKCGFLR